MDLKLKQRLMGAIVLVALAVIFIPVILEGPSDEWAPRSHSIPVPPLIDYKADMEPPAPDMEPQGTSGETAAQTPDSAAETVMQEPVPEPSAEDATPVVEEAAPAAAAATATTGTPTAGSQPAQQAAAPAGGWYVQVGSFGQQMNANGLRDRLDKAGYSARLEETGTDKGTVYRVLVGPEKQRTPAERLRDRLANEQKLKGIIVER